MPDSLSWRSAEVPQAPRRVVGKLVRRAWYTKSFKFLRSLRAPTTIGRLLAAIAAASKPQLAALAGGNINLRHLLQINQVHEAAAAVLHAFAAFGLRFGNLPAQVCVQHRPIGVELDLDLRQCRIILLACIALVFVACITEERTLPEEEAFPEDAALSAAAALSEALAVGVGCESILRGMPVFFLILPCLLLRLQGLSFDVNVRDEKVAHKPPAVCFLGRRVDATEENRLQQRQRQDHVHSNTSKRALIEYHVLVRHVLCDPINKCAWKRIHRGVRSQRTHLGN
mmetsp:Transcript_87707/g.252936  ORF Transcript_87707/g.252936 Transcript_87707/m.252936 type:complete len:284 (-) Transcript_87707:1155-2006(-)